MVERWFCCVASWLAFTSHKQQVLAYYCDNDRCDFDEYCCGHNICCTSYNVWQMWYFWLGLVIFLILLAGCFSFWRYRYQQALVVQSCSHSGYNPLASQHSIPNLPPNEDLATSSRGRDHYTEQTFTGMKSPPHSSSVYT